MSRENDRPREPWEEPAEEDSYEGDARLRERPPRSARPSMNRGSTPVDRSVHPRKRPRQGGDPRATGNDRPELYERHPKRRLDPSRSDDPRRAYDAYGRPRQGRPSQGNRPPVDPEFEECDRPALRPATRMQPSQRPRRIWSTLLIGCIGGIVTVLLILGIIAFVLFRI